MAHGQKFWMKLYTKDWRSDEKLKMCSLAARGLWIEMVCFMNGGTDEIGYLRINGRSLGEEEMARACGVSIDEVHPAWEELERWNVIKRDSDGCVFSSRMVKDHAQSIQGRLSKLEALGQGIESDPLEGSTERPLKGGLKGGLKGDQKGPFKPSLTSISNSDSDSCSNKKERSKWPLPGGWLISSKLCYHNRIVVHRDKPADIAVPENLASSGRWLEKFKEWCVYRSKEKRNALTWTSVRNQLKAMERAGPDVSVEAMDSSMMNGWVGVFPEKTRPSKKGYRGQATDDVRRKQFEEMEKKL